MQTTTALPIRAELANGHFPMAVSCPACSARQGELCKDQGIALESAHAERVTDASLIPVHL